MDPIDLYVIRPEHVERPPVVLYLFSYPSETDRFKNDAFCRRFTENGYAAVGFVSALTGHRYTFRPMRQWFISELQESLVTTVHDVQMILNYLTTRGDLDMNRAGMFGIGSGATIAILAASADPRIKAAQALDPWGDWSDWLAHSAMIPDSERPAYLKPEFQKRVAFLDPVQVLPKLKGRRVCIEDIMDDPFTPATSKQRIESAAPPSAKIIHFQDRNALYKDSAENGGPFRWIKEQLRR
jgi:dienelactone hydrolase